MGPPWGVCLIPQPVTLDTSLLLSWSARAKGGRVGVFRVGSLVTGGLAASAAVPTPSHEGHMHELPGG